MGKFKDLTGKKINNWIVIKQGKDKFISNGKNRPKIKMRTWTCKCMCGFCNQEIRDILEKNLINNKSKGCGKLSRYKNGKNNKKYNKYDLTGEYGIGYTSNGEEFYFDLEDYNKIKNYCWGVLDKKDKYIVTSIKYDYKYKKILMHNLIMNNLEKDFVIDHKNGKPFDNKKQNLRRCKQINNIKNLKLYKNNKSGTKGVCFSEKEYKWKAYIQYDNKKINLGSFKNKEDAIEIRKKAEVKYFGEYNREEEYL